MKFLIVGSESLINEFLFKYELKDDCIIFSTSKKKFKVDRKKFEIYNRDLILQKEKSKQWKKKEYIILSEMMVNQLLGDFEVLLTADRELGGPFGGYYGNIFYIWNMVKAVIYLIKEEAVKSIIFLEPPHLIDTVIMEKVGRKCIGNIFINDQPSRVLPWIYSWEPHDIQILGILKNKNNQNPYNSSVHQSNLDHIICQGRVALELIKGKKDVSQINKKKYFIKKIFDTCSIVKLIKSDLSINQFRREVWYRHLYSIYRKIQYSNELIKNQKNVDHWGIVFFLHTQPEMTTIPRAGLSAQQFSIINAIAQLLPNLDIGIKEHPMTFERGFAYKYRHHYLIRDVCCLENISVVPLKLDTPMILSKVDIIATITGTVALEALAAGVPVLYFGGGPKFVEDHPLCEIISSLSETEDKINLLKENKIKFDASGLDPIKFLCELMDHKKNKFTEGDSLCL